MGKNDALMVAIKGTIMDKFDLCKKNIQDEVKKAIEVLIGRDAQNSGMTFVKIGNVHDQRRESFFSDVYDYIIQIQQDQNIKLSDDEFTELEKELHGHCFGLITSKNKEINDYIKRSRSERLQELDINDGVQIAQQEITKRVERLKTLTHNRKDPPDLKVQKYSLTMSIIAIIISLVSFFKP